MSTSERIDGLFATLRPWGGYQIRQLIVIFTLTIPATNELLAVLYTGYQPPVRCKGINSSLVDENFVELGNSSDYTMFRKKCGDVVDVVNRSRAVGSCSRGYEYSQSPETTYVTEWDLVCSRAYQAQLPQSLIIVGQLVGAWIFTSLADRFGRRKISLLSQMGILTTSVASAWSPNIGLFMACRFLTGAFQQGLVMSMTVMSMELLLTKHRTLTFLLLGSTWSIYMQVLNGIGYAFRFSSWRYLQTLCGLSVLPIFVINICFLEESFRWLFANGRRKEVNKILTRAIRLNKAPEEGVRQRAEECFLKTAEPKLICNGDFELSPVGENPPVSSDDTTEKKRLSLLVILSTPRLRVTACIMVFVWMVNALTHFGLVLTSAKLAGNRFVNYTLHSLDMLPATFVAFFSLTRVGRKVACCTFQALSGVSLIVAVLLRVLAGPGASAWVTVFTVAGKFGSSASFLLLFQYTPELYPTNLRSFGLGLASSASRLGGALAPFSNLLMDKVPWAPGVVYGVCSLIACLCIMVLPETRTKLLPQTVQEIKRWNTQGPKNAKA